MLLHKRAIKAATAATTTDQHRPALANLHLHASGMVEATNGRVLVQITPTAPVPDAGYPVVNGADHLVGDLAKPVQIPAETAGRLVKALPKRSPFPALEHIRIGTKDDHVYATATDLEIPSVVCIDTANVSDFPDCGRVMTSAAPKGGSVKVQLAADVLTALIKVAVEMGTNGKQSGITLTIPTHEPHVTTPIPFAVAAADFTVAGVAMPMRID
jgi:hypothetical protein